MSAILPPGDLHSPLPIMGRDDAAAIIRQIGGRADAALHRELDRCFASRSGLSHADRTAIVRAMSRFRNQLLRRPRYTLRAAAAGEVSVAPLLIEAVRRLFGLTEPSPSDVS